MSLAFVTDELFLHHVAPGAHPERPERLRAVHQALKEAGVDRRARALPLRAATDGEIGLVHTASHFDDLAKRLPGQSGWLDSDTYYSPGTWDAVLGAVGAAVDATLAVLEGQAHRAMAMVRPPGHHAEADRAMGFCLFNNVAVAAAAARARGVDRVAIVDWDVHHGNGTQHIFERDPSVMYLSSHQYPFYPGTGAAGEVGKGAGLGTTVNVGLPAGCGDEEYAAAFREVFVPAMRDFDPDLILISAGFDHYVADPLASMQVTGAGFAHMARTLTALADEVCDGRIVAVLEGGYDLQGVGGGAVALLEAFAREPAAAQADEAKGANPTIDGVGDILPAARQAIEASKSALRAARATLAARAEAAAAPAGAADTTSATPNHHHDDKHDEQ